MNNCYTRFYGIILVLMFSTSSTVSVAQGGEEYSPEKIEEYKANVQNLVDFLEFSFNTLGNPQTSARDKDVIINQSYAKIFVNGEVQVEDDLDDNRETLINKDVQAYLKDIDFFFKEAVFSLNVSSIDHHFKADNEIYFIVSLTRTLNAMTVTDDTVSSNKERFIEVNYDDDAQDLRIASIYTTKIDEKDELFAWWNKMPTAWRELLGHEAFIEDTVRLSKVVEINDTMAIAEYIGIKEVPIDTFLVYGSDTLHINETEMVEGVFRDSIMLRKNFSYRMLQRIASEPEIDISGNLHIRSLAPLTQMGDLRKVNCSNTMVDDLGPLRSLIGIESLDCSGTSVTSLKPMQYSVSLISLDIEATAISDLEPVTNLRKLVKFNFSDTPADSLEVLADMRSLNDIRFSNTLVSNVEPLENLEELRIVNFSGTNVSDLSPLAGLINLERLYISNTMVSDLEALSNLHKLQTIYLDSTGVSNLQPLSGLEDLESVYCDNTGIKASKANKFMAENPNTLVVYESVALANWWEGLTQEWKNVFRQLQEMDEMPSKEQLHQIAQSTSIDISANQRITSLDPLRMLRHLQTLDCSSTAISDLWPLSDLIDLHSLNCANTIVSDCEGLRDLMNLEHLNISNTQIGDIKSLSRLKNLRELNIAQTSVSAINVFESNILDIIYADNSQVGLSEVKAFKKDNPECIIVYQTSELEAWWAGLNSDWQEVFTSAAALKNAPSPTELQMIADLSEIELGKRKNLGSLVPLQKLYQLQSLKMNDTQISDLGPLEISTTLETLIISDNPIVDLNNISGLSKLKHLEFENTPVSDLIPLTGLTDLESLNMAGTQIKKLNEIAVLSNLKQISFFNTGIKSLSPLEGLPALEHIKCYNTRLNEKKVRKFQEVHPSCEVIFY